MDFYQQSHVDKKSDYSRMTSHYISIISDQIWKFKFYIFLKDHFNQITRRNMIVVCPVYSG